MFGTILVKNVKVTREQLSVRGKHVVLSQLNQSSAPTRVQLLNCFTRQLLKLLELILCSPSSVRSTCGLILKALSQELPARSMVSLLFKC
jgi:hypothetical protein